MAIITPNVSTNIDPGQAPNREADLLIKMLLQGQQIGAGVADRQQAGQQALAQQNNAQRLKTEALPAELTAKSEALKNLVLGAPVAGSPGLREAPFIPKGADVTTESVGFKHKEPNLMAQQAAQIRQDRLDESKRQHAAQEIKSVEKSVESAGLPQSIESLRRAESQIPGITEGKANFISVGGMKNLVPNFLVGALEKVSVMPKGSSEERAALQELSNAKIYDSSGKQINEAEMKRIQDAMGLRGVSDTNALNQAAQQVANTVQQKRAQIQAGSEPEALATYEGRGGLAGQKSLADLIKPQQAAPSPRMSFEEFKARKAAGKL